VVDEIGEGLAGELVDDVQDLDGCAWPWTDRAAFADTVIVAWPQV
jgi:predicted ATPase